MYTEMVTLIRKLYQECRLVHGDLSEYNILVNEVTSPTMRLTLKSGSMHLQSSVLPKEYYPGQTCILHVTKHKVI